MRRHDSWRSLNGAPRRGPIRREQRVAHAVRDVRAAAHAEGLVRQQAHRRRAVRAHALAWDLALLSGTTLALVQELFSGHESVIYMIVHTYFLPRLMSWRIELAVVFFKLFFVSDEETTYTFCRL